MIAEEQGRMRPVTALIVREVKDQFFAWAFHSSIAITEQADNAAAFDVMWEFRLMNACPLSIGRIEVVGADSLVAL